jgi:hypothetical protein
MPPETNNDITVISFDQVALTTELQTSIATFNPVMARYLADLGLPIDNVLSPIEERKKVFVALGSALEVLPLEDRQKAYYLTRFAVAITVGLFDGALSYLWDETIKSLRRLVARFDLGYFYSVAEKISSKNKNFHTEDDLNGVDDHDLLEACRRIGLISDVNYKRLEHVNYMRNHASSAHPNENELDGHEIVGWLSNCLRHAITAEPEHSVIKVKMLLENIRTQVIPIWDISGIGNEIVLLGIERVDDLLWTLFGIYVDPRQSSSTKDNIANLAPYVWPAATEDRKYEIGSKFGTFRKNADIQRKDAAGAFLTIVSGNKYKDEDSLAGELIDKLDALKASHFGRNNFYNEYPHAKVLEDVFPANGVIPRAARPSWVKVIAICFIGNGLGYKEGVDESALPFYQHYISKFSESEVIEFLHLFGDQEFTASLGALKCDERTRALVTLLYTKTTNAYVQQALSTLYHAPTRTLDRVNTTAVFINILRNIPKAP